MTEREIVHLVAARTEPFTDFDDPCWEGIDPSVLNSCFDKGFLRWSNGKLVLTALGRIACSGLQDSGAQLHKNARFDQ